MTLKDYTETSTALITLAKQIEDAKRPAYTIGDADVLANFKRIASRTGLTPGQVLAVYMLKHIDAITAALTNPMITQSEELEGRFADALNYVKLAFALLVEQGLADAKGTEGNKGAD